MNVKTLLLGSSLLLLTPSCGAAGSDDATPSDGVGGAAGSGGSGGGSGAAGADAAAPEKPSPPKEGQAELFGEPLSASDNFVHFDDLMQEPAVHEGVLLQTEGIVRSNCNKKGCWMEVRSPGDAASPGLTVRFKNYGFFIPLDSRGATVRIEGLTAVQVLTAEEVAHMQSEGYDLAVNEDGTAHIVSFMANGVEMWGRN